MNWDVGLLLGQFDGVMLDVGLWRGCAKMNDWKVYDKVRLGASWGCVYKRAIQPLCTSTEYGHYGLLQGL